MIFLGEILLIWILAGWFQNKKIPRKKAEEILDLNKLHDDEKDTSNFVFENGQKDNITFVDIEQEKERANQRKLTKNNEEVK